MARDARVGMRWFVLLVWVLPVVLALMMGARP
jgi:hypothetical protein